MQSECLLFVQHDALWPPVIHVGPVNDAWLEPGSQFLDLLMDERTKPTMKISNVSENCLFPDEMESLWSGSSLNVRCRGY